MVRSGPAPTARSTRLRAHRADTGRGRLIRVPGMQLQPRGHLILSSGSDSGIGRLTPRPRRPGPGRCESGRQCRAHGADASPRGIRAGDTGTGRGAPADGRGTMSSVLRSMGNVALYSVVGQGVRRRGPGQDQDVGLRRDVTRYRAQREARLATPDEPLPPSHSAPWRRTASRTAKSCSVRTWSTSAPAA
jgi:hypothetical protein